VCLVGGGLEWLMPDFLNMVTLTNPTAVVGIGIALLAGRKTADIIRKFIEK